MFEVKYYKGKNTASGTPDGTWYFATDASGIIKFLPGYVYNGSNFASTNLPDVSDNGAYLIETGTLVLTEVVAPNGYLNIDGSDSNKGFISYQNLTTGTGEINKSNSISVYLELGTGALTFYVGNQAVESEITYNDAPNRGELKFIKKKLNADGSTSAMAGVVFKIMLFII